MIEHGHEHYFQPVARNALPTGTQLLRQCVCGMEERRTFLEGEPHPYEITYRYNGMWLPALDLVRILAGVPIEECETCHGQAQLDACGRCGGLGVTESGERLGLTDFAVHG